MNIAKSSLTNVLSIAPMIDWSYIHFRVLMRILAPKATVYTEMKTVGALIHQPEKALAFHPSELPHLVLQLGGSDPNALAQAARLAAEYGYPEINLNLGCPSERVLSGQFGACLMREPDLVARCIQAMKSAVSIPITAKVRIGVDDQDSYDFFSAFVGKLVDAGCDKLIVHARKAWLKGLSPKENRTLPPLHYDYAYRIKKEHPDLPVILNGNVSVDDVSAHLTHLDGVMFGRLACQNPYEIASVHHSLYPENPLILRSEAIQAYWLYLCGLEDKNIPISLLLKPILNFAHGLPYAKRWKASLVALKTNSDLEHLNCLAYF